MEKIVSGRDAVAVDLFGFGATPAPPEPWGAREYARALLPILEEAETPAVLVGFSFGGRVALSMAATRPDKVRALVLTGVPLLRKSKPRKAPIRFRLLRAASQAGLISDVRIEAERKKRGSPDYRRASGVMRDVLVRVVNETYEDELRTTTCPVDLVWGENDTEVPVGIAERARQLIKAPVTLTIVPGGTHFLPVEDPAAINSSVDKWLA